MTPTAKLLLWETFEVNIDTQEVKLNGINAIRTDDPSHGPLMVQHKLVLAGRPTSVYDIAAAVRQNEPVQKWNRIVPVDRDFNRPVSEVASRPELFEEVHHSDLHGEFMRNLRWRGRPSSFTQFHFGVLRDWRDAVFSGQITIRELAKLAKVNEKSAARFAHGETLWWL